MTRLRRLFYAIYMAFKRRGGFVDLDCERTVEGTVMLSSVDLSNLDGDATFDLWLEPDDYDVACFAGRCRQTIHCEVPPGRPDLAAELAEVLRSAAYPSVRVTGRLAFDGSHHGRGLLLDVLAAVVGWPANVRDGWLEIHPVTHLEVVP